MICTLKIVEFSTLISWTVIFILPWLSWYQIYKMSQEIFIILPFSEKLYILLLIIYLGNILYLIHTIVWPVSGSTHL